MIYNIRRILWYLIYRYQFDNIDISSYIYKPIYLTPKYISCGKNVFIRNGGRIEGVEIYSKTKYKPRIILKDNVTIEQNCHITCGNLIEIGANTAIAANVTITDINHVYVDIAIAIERQEIEVFSVIIGEDSKIYNNAVILPDVKIGKHVVIGANSVVTKDIPDYCVAVGTPAEIIKRYDFQMKRWRRTDNNGNFTDK